MKLIFKTKNITLEHIIVRIIDFLLYTTTIIPTY